MHQMAHRIVQSTIRRLVACVALASLAACFTVDSIILESPLFGDRWRGVRAPELSVETLDGTRFELSELRGRRVAVHVWRAQCGLCAADLPSLRQIREEFPEEDLAIVALRLRHESDDEEIQPDATLGFPVAVLDELPTPYGDVPGHPTTFFIDRNGVIEFVSEGFRGDNALRKGAQRGDFEGNLGTSRWRWIDAGFGPLGGSEALLRGYEHERRR